MGLEWLVEMFKLGFDVPLLLRREKMGCMAHKPTAELVDPHGVLLNCGECRWSPSTKSSRGPARCPSCRPSGGCGGHCPSNRYAIGDLAHGTNPDRRAFTGFRERVRRGEYPCRDERLAAVRRIVR